MQLGHTDALDDDEYRPTAHLVQAAAAVAEKRPALHVPDTADSPVVEQKLPAEQPTHALCLEAAWNVPIEQLKQTIAAVAEYCPAKQLSHDV